MNLKILNYIYNTFKNLFKGSLIKKPFPKKSRKKTFSL